MVEGEKCGDLHFFCEGGGRDSWFDCSFFRLLALKCLQSKNMLKNLAMMMHETLTCYILGVSSVSGLNYASLRGNEIGARYVAKPNHHDMAKIIAGLVESLEDSDKVSEVVSRYVNLLKYSQVLKTALRSICKWPLDCLQFLANIIIKYECYQTLDTDTRLMNRSNQKLMDGIKLEMPVVLFKEIARFPHEFLREHADSILEDKLSVKQLVKEFTNVEERKKKVAKIEESAGFQSIDQLRNNFPEKFTEDIVDKLPVVRPSSGGDKPFVENYTKIVIDESKEDPEAGLKEMECLELEQDIQELKRVCKYARRSNVKQEINGIVDRFESKLKKIKSPPQDPYKFPATSSKDWSGAGENYKQ